MPAIDRPGREGAEAVSAEKKERRRVEIREDQGAAHKPELKEAAEKDREKAEKQIQDIKRRFRAESGGAGTETGEVILAYQEKYLPAHLKEQSAVGSAAVAVVNGLLKFRELLGKFRVEGKRNIPKQGSFLIASNHSGGETGPILSVFGDKNVHIAAGEELNFNRSPFRKWLLEKMGTIPVPESLANLSDKEKDDLLTRVPDRSKAGYKRIIDQERVGKRANSREFIRRAVALISRGEPVAVFPEGLFTYEGRGLRKAYRGIELLAKEYKKLTGEELTILPVGVRQGGLKIGETTTMPEVEDADGVMRQISELLSKDERGIYQ